MVTQITALLSQEGQRKGVWDFVGEATGAKLVCPTRGRVLRKEDIISPDGTLMASDSVNVDNFTGLLVPKPGGHMQLSNGHIMPVPPHFFLHPQTGRLLPMAGNVSYETLSSTLVITVDTCAMSPARWDVPMIPYVPYPGTHVTQRLRGLRQGERLAFGDTICDVKTGLSVPILAVTIHPGTGQVYPLGGVHLCPIMHLPRPIQIGSPMQRPDGSLALVTGVTLSDSSGEVVPVGGILLAESFIEPLSGRAARVRGVSVQGGRTVPHAGGYQALLDAQALQACKQAALLLHEAVEACGPGQHEWDGLSRLRTAGKEAERAFLASQHWLLQLVCRLEIQLDWAKSVAQDGGSQGEISFPGSELVLPALPGFEYPDPEGSGLRVPVLGVQLDWISGRPVVLAGTMEDAEGKGIVPIRIGVQALDPVTGNSGRVVGARVDAVKKTVVPVVAFHGMATQQAADRVQVEMLHRECRLRSSFWQRQQQQEEDLLKELDGALLTCLGNWRERRHLQVFWRQQEEQMRARAAELEKFAQAEAQRRATAHSELALLPPYIQLILTGGEEQEQEQQSWLQVEMLVGLDRVSVTVDRLLQDNDMGAARQTADPEDGVLRLRDVWEKLNCRQMELEEALCVQLCQRDLCRLCGDIAQAVLSGSFCYREFGGNHIQVQGEGTAAVAQRRVLLLLPRLVKLMEERKVSPGESDKQTLGVLSSAWTASQPTLKGERRPSAALLDPGQVRESRSPREVAETSAPFLHPNSAEELPWQPAGGQRPFLDLLDAQWQCEGELVPVSPHTLNPRELMLFQYGKTLLQALHQRAKTPEVSLHLASSLPNNNYNQNAFRCSFFYQEAERSLFVRRQRLQCVGGFLLLLLHCAAHAATGDMSSDSSPTFQRVFFRVLEICLNEHFLSSLGSSAMLSEEQPGPKQPLPNNVQRDYSLWRMKNLLRELQSEVRSSSQELEKGGGHNPKYSENT